MISINFLVRLENKFLEFQKKKNHFPPTPDYEDKQKKLFSLPKYHLHLWLIRFPFSICSEHDRFWMLSIIISIREWQNFDFDAIFSAPIIKPYATNVRFSFLFLQLDQKIFLNKILSSIWL